MHARSGARTRHNRIATSVLGIFIQNLKGRKCEPFNSDMKVRIPLITHVRFYYPDAMVVCQPNADKDAFQDHPKVIVEVLSRRTRRLDMGEKLEGYLSLGSLGVYLLVEQGEPTVIANRRSDQGFEREVYQGLEAVIPLPEIDCQLPLTEIYERVEFGPEPEDEDQD